MRRQYIKEKGKDTDPASDEYYIAAPLANALRDLGFQSIPVVVKVLRRWAVELESYNPETAIKLAPTHRSRWESALVHCVLKPDYSRNDRSGRRSFGL